MTNQTEDAAEPEKLPETSAPPEAINLNVGGKELADPGRGFGQLWRKTYRVRLAGTGLGPEAVIRRWRDNFGAYWPEGNDFYGSRTRIEPGEVALINLQGPGGAPIATGVAVVDAGDWGFTFMTPQGHVFAGTITFSARREGGDTVAQIVSLIRAGDPLFELGARLGIVHKTEDAFWAETLRNLAADVGVVDARVEQRTELLDRRVRWSAAANVWHNSAIRTTLYLPIHAVKRMFGRGAGEGRPVE
jgi:hypothetical protein